MRCKGNSLLMEQWSDLLWTQLPATMMTHLLWNSIHLLIKRRNWINKSLSLRCFVWIFCLIESYFVHFIDEGIGCIRFCAILYSDSTLEINNNTIRSVSIWRWPLRVFALNIPRLWYWIKYSSSWKQRSFDKYPECSCWESNRIQLSHWLNMRMCNIAFYLFNDRNFSTLLSRIPIHVRRSPTTAVSLV